MLPCCSRSQRSRVGISAGAAAPMRGDGTRQPSREREFDDEDSAADASVSAGVDAVDNPLAWGEPQADDSGYREANGDGGGEAEAEVEEEEEEEEEEEFIPLWPVALVPRDGAEPDIAPDAEATVLPPGAQLPVNGIGVGGVCIVGSETYVHTAGVWVLVANAGCRLERWERGFSAETRKLAAFEVLLRCVGSIPTEHGEDEEEDLVDAVRVQLQIRYVLARHTPEGAALPVCRHSPLITAPGCPDSRKMCRKMQAWGLLDGEHPEGAAYDPVALLRERKIEDFDTEADFDGWFDRQIGFCTASSCWEKFWNTQVRWAS